MKREKEKYRSFGLVAYGWRSLHEPGQALCSKPPVHCLPSLWVSPSHSPLVAVGEQMAITASKKAPRPLPSYFLGTGPQIGSRNPEPALPATPSPRSDSLYASISLSLIVSGWTRRPLRSP